MVMATVGNIIKTKADGTCSTASVKNLSLQVIDEMNLLIPNVLVSFDDLDVSGNQATVNFFLQPKAKEALRRAIRNKGKTLRLTSAYRTVVQQHILFSWQGSECVFIAAKPGWSNHEDGLAIDTPDWKNGYRLWQQKAGSGWEIMIRCISPTWVEVFEMTLEKLESKLFRFSGINIIPTI
jgi:hypothetical protein